MHQVLATSTSFEDSLSAIDQLDELLASELGKKLLRQYQFLKYLYQMRLRRASQLRTLMLQRQSLGIEDLLACRHSGVSHG
jgi:hypothetical protein